MSDGPYRETRAPDAAGGITPIVLPDELPPPSLRFVVTDFSDGSTSISLLRTTPGLKGALHGALAVGMLPLVSVAAHAWMLGGVLVVGAALISAARGVMCALPIEKIVISKSGLAYERGLQRGIVLLDEIGRIYADENDRREGRVTVLMRSERRSRVRLGVRVRGESALEPPEAGWLAGRLTRAVERIRR